MARFANGYVKAWRSMWDGDLADNPILFAIWNGLLQMAIWKETSIVWDGKRKDLCPGSVIFGIREFSSRWRISPSTVSKHLRYLRDTGRITLETRTRGSLATICNWDGYQGEIEFTETPDGHELDTSRTPGEHGPNLIEEGKKERRKKAGTVNPASATGIYPRVDEILASRGVKEETQRAWKAAYPDDSWVSQRILDAAAWEVSNPSRKKVNFAAFVTRWLAKDWDKRSGQRSYASINTTPLKIGDIA